MQRNLDSSGGPDAGTIIIVLRVPLPNLVVPSPDRLLNRMKAKKFQAPTSSMIF